MDKKELNFVLQEGEEIPEVPIEAIREALVNSFCHRDYFRPEGNKVAIFKDRIEIYNPGAFPENKTPEDFINKEEESILRNPTIAHNLFLSKDIEKWGFGIRRIYNVCKKNNVKVEFLRLSDGFKVVFYRRDVPEKVTENQKKILDIINKNSRSTVVAIAKEIKISRKSVLENISKLKEKGLLKRIGPDRGGYWEVIKK